MSEIIKDREQARAMLNAIDTAIDAVSKASWPQPTIHEVGTFEDPESEMRCPWTGKAMSDEGGIVALDASFRHTDGTIDFDDRLVSFYYEGGHHEGVAYLCGCCHLPIDLPDGWDES